MLFLKEIKYRKLNFLLGVLGVVAAVAMVVVFITMTKASQNETRRLTRYYKLAVPDTPAAG